VSHGGILRALRVRCGVHDDFAFGNLSGQWFEVDGDSITPGALVNLVEADHPVTSTPL
jgi:hypothetical protein